MKSTISGASLVSHRTNSGRVSPAASAMSSSSMHAATISRAPGRGRARAAAASWAVVAAMAVASSASSDQEAPAALLCASSTCCRLARSMSAASLAKLIARATRRSTVARCHCADATGSFRNAGVTTPPLPSPGGAAAAAPPPPPPVASAPSDGADPDASTAAGNAREWMSME